MFDKLNAAIFKFALPFYSTSFETLLSKITLCYQFMIRDNVSLENNENKIRDVLLINYLSDNAVRKRIGLLPWNFEREVAEDRLTGRVGRTDIKVITLDTFTDQTAYYIIECKRLNDKNLSGKTGLNAKYIQEGIKRYTDKYYSSHYRVNAMVGFVVKNIDIDANTAKINSLLMAFLPYLQTQQLLSKTTFIEDFEYQYQSTHLDVDGDALKIYHLMFDFSDNII